MCLVLSDGVIREKGGTACVAWCTDTRPSYLTMEACRGDRKNVPQVRCLDSMEVSGSTDEAYRLVGKEG